MLLLDHGIAGNPALASMDDARFGAFAALDLAGDQPHAASAAMAGAAIVRKVDTIAQSSVEQQLAAAREEAFAVDGNLVTSCHLPFPANPRAFFRSQRQIHRCRASATRSNPGIPNLKHFPHSLGGRTAFSFIVLHHRVRTMTL